MSAEQVDETSVAIVTEIKDILLDKRLAKRAGQILDQIDRSRESQRATGETMRLFVHTPKVG